MIRNQAESPETAGASDAAGTAVAAETRPVGRSYGVRVDVGRVSYEMAIRGWQGIDLAKVAGVSDSSVSAALLGRPISQAVLDKIAKAIASTKPREDLIAIIPRPA